MTNATEQTAAAPELTATLLTDKETCGDEFARGQLQVMKSYDTITGMSDLAVLLGGAVCSSDNTTRDGQRSACVGLASSDEFGKFDVVDYEGYQLFDYPYARYLGARPVLPSSVASSIRLSDSTPEALAKGEAIRGNPIKDSTTGKVIWNDVILYGEYPQAIADETALKELNGLSEDQLKRMETGKTYHFDGEKLDACDKPFKPKAYVEYQFKGKKYIRVEAKTDGRGYSMLSNGKQAQAGQSYWVEVQPIEWLKDPSGTLVARQALFAGVQFHRTEIYYGSFQDTDMYRYLQEYFVKEIQPSKGLAQEAGEAHLAESAAVVPKATEETEVAAEKPKPNVHAQPTGRAERFAEIRGARAETLRRQAVAADRSSKRRPSDGWGKAL